MSTPDLASLRERVVIITGGGRGLGREMALALVEDGAWVMITAAHSRDELDAVVAESASAPGRIISALANASEYADCERVLAQTLNTFGGVHCLVNNAGRGMRLVSESFTTKPALFWQTDPAAWQEIIACNLNGAFNMARAITPALVNQGFGKIINISTSLQTMVRTGYSPYGPSKAALEAASRVWASDLTGTGVSVNVLLPGGATDTALLPDMPDKRGADGLLLTPDIMRAPIAWLCSDASNDHTGERYIATAWNTELPLAQAADKARQKKIELPQIM